MKKRFLCMMLVLCCIFGLVGCGGGSDAEIDSVPVMSSNVVVEQEDSKGDITEDIPLSQETPKSSILPSDSTFNIHFIDVGQADAALIECDGHYMLIDGGNRADSNTIYSVLSRNNVDYLDIVVGTHAHEDHIGGIPGAFNYATAGLTLSPVKSYDSTTFDNFKKYADQNGGGLVIPKIGNTYSLGSAEVKILGVNGGDDTNDTSIVLMITYGSTRFLFTGDAEREAEETILNSGVDLSSTFLKVGHHGSGTSTTYPFLREVMPKYAVISVGTDNSYGHPAEETVSRLRDANVQVFRTDLQGDIYCVSDGNSLTFTVDKNSNVSVPDTPAPVVVQPSQTVPDKPVVSTKSEIEPEPIPSGPYYVLNTNSKKFHEPTCGSVNNISSDNKEYSTNAAEDLVEKGYEPCGNCKPYDIPEPETEEDLNTSSSPGTSEPMVWISKTGSKYHSKSSCSNMKTPSEVSKSQAESKGLTACSKCW